MWAPKVEQTEALQAGDCSTSSSASRTNKLPFNDGVSGAARRQVAGSGGEIAEAAGRAGRAMSEFRCIAPDVKLGENVKLCEVHQSLRLRDRRRDQDRRLRGSPEERQDRQALQDLQPHLHLRRRHHRGQCLHRPWGDRSSTTSIPRATAPGGGLQTEADWKVETTLVKKGASIGSGATILAT